PQVPRSRRSDAPDPQPVSCLPAGDRFQIFESGAGDSRRSGRRRRSGEPYKKYIEEHILKPLAMQSTRVAPEPTTPGLAVGYRKRVPGQPKEPEDFIDAGGLIPAASFASSVEDLAKFCALEFRDGPAGGAQILRGSTLFEMRRIEWLQ